MPYRRSRRNRRTPAEKAEEQARSNRILLLVAVLVFAGALVWGLLGNTTPKQDEDVITVDPATREWSKGMERR